MYNGVIYNDSSTAIAQVTDGTSNTMLFAEHSHFMATLNDPNFYVSDNSWQSGRWYDTLFSTLYPISINLQALPAQVNGPFGYYSITAANSLHPGGANFAYCDGSVRFLKSTINTWSVSGNSTDPAGNAIPDGSTTLAVSNPSGTVHLFGSAQLGVYQKLSTRSGARSSASTSIDSDHIAPTTNGARSDNTDASQLCMTGSRIVPRRGLPRGIAEPQRQEPDPTRGSTLHIPQRSGHRSSALDA